MPKRSVLLAGLFVALLPFASAIAAEQAAGADKPKVKVRADFLGEGTFATEDDCKSQRAFEATGSYAGETPPRLITAEGAKVGGEPCVFASVAQRGAGWTADMTCSGGCENYTESFTFTAHSAGGFEITVPESDKKLHLVRCEPSAAKPRLTN